MSQEAIGGRVGIVTSEWWLLTWPLPDGYRLGQNWKAYMIPFDASNTEKLYSARSELGARYVARAGFEHPEALVKMCNLYQERALTGIYPANIYRTDGEFAYDGLAAFGPVTGVERNEVQQQHITMAVDNKDTSYLNGEDDWSKYNSVMGYINGTDKDNPDIFATNFMWWRAYYGPESIFAMQRTMKEDGLYLVDAYYDPPTATMAELQGPLKSMAEEAINNIIAGVEPVDYFDTFVKNWYDGGGTAWTDEVNTWYANKQ